MNCKDAQQLIDLLVHDSSEDVREIKTAAQWAELDSHLAACPQCRSEVEELRRVRRLLATAAGDRPSDREIDSMWSVIQNPALVPAALDTDSAAGWWGRNRSLVVSLVGAAAVLMLAFQLGNLRYGERLERLVSSSNPKGIGSSAKVYDAEDRRLGGNYLIGGNLDSRHTPARINYSSGLEPANHSDFGLGVDARFPRSADSAQSQSGPPLATATPAPPVSIEGRHPAPPQHTRLYFDKSTASEVKRDARHAGATAEEAGNSYGIEQLSPPRNQPVFGLPHVNAQFDATDYDPDLDLEVIDKGGSNASTTAIQNAPRQNLKIIKTGELGIEVPAYGDAVARVEKIAGQAGGFIANASTSEGAGGALVGHMVIRMSPEKFEEIFAALKAVGRVESENVKAADVTAEYVDTEARIHSLKITEERLRELIANKSFVDKIASLLEVERELNRVRTEIEKFEGQLRLMADRVALSTIVLTIREPGRTVPSASLSVEVATLDEATQKMADLLGKTSGRLVSAKTSKRGDGTLMGTFQLETTLARFAEVVAGIEALGRVEDRQISDQQFGKDEAPWAEHVKCAIALLLFERTRQLPSGTLRLEVDELDEAMKRLGEMLQSHDATMASNQANRLSNGTQAAEIRIRVPAGRFAEFVETLTKLGRTISKTVSGETDRIVGGAAAVPCDVSLTLAEEPREVPQGSMSIEVANFETARQALSRAIGEREVQVLDSTSNQRPDGTWQGSFRLGVPAREMEAFVKAAEALGRVAARQISGLGLGDLSRTDPDGLGVIELTMSEKSTLAPAASESAASIRVRVREGLEGFYSSMGLIAYGLVVLLPWLVLALLVGWIVARVTRRSRAKRAISRQAN